MTKLEIYQKIHVLPEHSRFIFWTLHEMVEENDCTISFYELGSRLYKMRATDAKETQPITWSSMKGAFGLLRERGLLKNSTEICIERGDPVTWKEIKGKQTYCTIYNGQNIISVREYSEWFYKKVEIKEVA